MTLPLDGKAALITGGGTGIGLACAQALHADGAHVTLAGRREDVVKAAAAEFGEAPLLAVRRGVGGRRGARR